MNHTLSKHRLHVVLAMFVLISFMLGCNEFMVVGNLTLIADSYHESLSQISWLVSVFAWTYAFATPFMAIFTSRFNKFYLLLSLLFIFLIGTVMSALSPNLSILLLSRIITAAVAGLIESILSVIIYQLTTDIKQRSLAVAWIYTGFSLASVIGIPIGTIIADHWRWQDSFIMVAVITAVAGLITVILLPRNLPGEKSHFKNQLVLFTDKEIWYGIIFIACSSASLYGYYTYVRPLIRQTLDFTASQLSLILLIIGVIDIFANQTSGRLASKNGFKTLRFIYILDMFLLLSFRLMMQNQWTGLILILALAYFIALSGSPTQVYFLDLATEKYPTAINLASTLNAVFYNVGIALSSMTAGIVLKYTDLSHLGWNSLAYCIVAAIMTFILAKTKIANHQ
ncbi:putative MFS family arabinose efflux permease [Lactobacillus colini]|uniref:MFS family arabinose efflux permease n=1 Tax=Lactobacillus colini TaxID=1819254 RepID=A0ABS4MBB7_9LACO|nr:MFS transporter [Lactobacillus colini]MBP2056965.1 putative MFS family arabinose efflux permease [Lactobacillus colini]